MPDSCFHRWMFVPRSSTLYLLVNLDGLPVVAHAIVVGKGRLAEFKDAQLRSGRQSVMLSSPGVSAYAGDIWLLFEDQADIVVDAWVEDPNGTRVAPDMHCTLSGKAGDAQAIVHLDIGMELA